MPDNPFFVPGRCYRRGAQMMHVLGPLFPTWLPEAERALWSEVSEEEWNEALARVSRARKAAEGRVHSGDLFEPGDPALGQLSRLSDGRGAALDPADPQHRLMLEIARDLRAAGFELHDCALKSPTGGVCLAPGPGGGVIVTWAQHDVLAGETPLPDIYLELEELMNYALAEVLAVMRWRLEPIAQAGAYVVIARSEEGAS